MPETVQDMSTTVAACSLDVNRPGQRNKLSSCRKLTWPEKAARKMPPGVPDEPTSNAPETNCTKATFGTQIKKDDVLYITYVDLAESSVFDDESTAANHLLKEAITQDCAVYTTDYKDVLKVLQEASSENLTDSVNLLLTDLPYNTRNKT